MSGERKTDGLTDRQRAFVREYLIDLNAIKAAERAGYSPGGARYAARDILTKPAVRAAVGAALKERGERTKITQDRVLQEIEHMALLDVSSLTTITSVEEISSLPENIRRAIVGWKYDRFGNLELKRAKETALQMLTKHHGLLNDKIEIDAVVNVTIQSLTTPEEQAVALRKANG